MTIITVVDSDIKVIPNGVGGAMMSYHGNGRQYIIEIPSFNEINKTQAQVVSEWVSYLNSIPITTNP